MSSGAFVLLFSALLTALSLAVVRVCFSIWPSLVYSQYFLQSALVLLPCIGGPLAAVIAIRRDSSGLEQRSRPFVGHFREFGPAYALLTAVTLYALIVPQDRSLGVAGAARFVVAFIATVFFATAVHLVYCVGKTLARRR